MDTVIWQKITGVESLLPVIIPKIVSTAVILIGARLSVKVLDIVLKQWQKNLIKKLKNSYQMIYSLETRFTIVMRVVAVGVYFFAVTLILLQFNALRALGAGLFASAGLATIVLGVAAQSTLSNIIAGLSISFSQPFRLHDSVVLEHEFGVVEEISLMHCVILTWDNRRMVIPNNIINNIVIENWTIKDPSMIGTVMFYVDYTCDIGTLRAWVKEIVAKSPNSTPELLAGVQVVDFTERAMAVRIVVKGPDPTKTWDLRCEIRESLISKFRQAGMPLPQMRVNFQTKPNI